MNLPEVRKLLTQLEEQKSSGAYLQVIKPLGWRPKGFKLRTCFGLAHILNVVDRQVSADHPIAHTSIVVNVPTVAIRRWLSRHQDQT